MPAQSPPLIDIAIVAGDAGSGLGAYQAYYTTVGPSPGAGGWLPIGTPLPWANGPSSARSTCRSSAHRARRTTSPPAPPTAPATGPNCRRSPTRARGDGGGPCGHAPPCVGAASGAGGSTRSGDTRRSGGTRRSGDTRHSGRPARVGGTARVVRPTRNGGARREAGATRCGDATHRGDAGHCGDASHCGDAGQGRALSERDRTAAGRRFAVARRSSAKRKRCSPPSPRSPGRSRGRTHPSEAHPYRTEYQKDRDRIIHTTAYRRLQYKTQVFVIHEGDYYRTRLTHTHETAQIARTIARALGANVDLAEAIALAHDLGHPSFGHSGERTLDRLMLERMGLDPDDPAHEGLGFNHTVQSLRVVDRLEKRWASFAGAQPHLGDP